MANGTNACPQCNGDIKITVTAAGVTVKIRVKFDDHDGDQHVTANVVSFELIVHRPGATRKTALTGMQPVPGVANAYMLEESFADFRQQRLPPGGVKLGKISAVLQATLADGQTQIAVEMPLKLGA